MVGRDIELAKLIVDAGKLERLAPGEILIRQGADDNHLLLILSGEVAIQINGREVARRLAGRHVGEMALVDSIARRSATVVALEKTVVLRLTEPKFTAIAKRHPDLWRRIAGDIATRLRDRSAGICPPNSKPLVFVGSSAEALSVASELHRQLQRRRLVSCLWTDGVFRASKTAIESLVELAGSADFACLVLSPDDITTSRGRTQYSARDNVTFELGLFIGALGRERVFILKPKNLDVRIPTDLLGVTWLEYNRGGALKMAERLKAAHQLIWNRVRTLGPR
ncbi:MAG: nucleotide-binding protein [Bacillota bacterium]|nr:nucleotide-binding protein [Bacillota bacterium]